MIGGGGALDRPGYFIAPTIVRDIKEGARLVDEEQYGPVLPVIQYSDLDDVIRRANDTVFGLGTSVWSTNIERARKVAASLEAGSIWINKHLDSQVDVPFGGMKESGIGVEYGEEGLVEFTQLQVISVA
ncbi:phenylacetaldehyde dehydrogenase [Caballeronia calidae]|uniref:Phenylacetaldehyde dehydrogenase n=1 Tax=Caballeronia calidae TaxID=1777139 RepID=A0A158EJR6_9BURK|nr:aldehyde dehydrogenase family protein [Caballeronia calidae]SAL06970.1 phenylacetaldehyde dehydrogenase [Caballeronia calidae]